MKAELIQLALAVDTDEVGYTAAAGRVEEAYTHMEEDSNGEGNIVPEAEEEEEAYFDKRAPMNSPLAQWMKILPELGQGRPSFGDPSRDSMLSPAEVAVGQVHYNMEGPFGLVAAAISLPSEASRCVLPVLQKPQNHQIQV